MTPWRFLILSFGFHILMWLFLNYTTPLSLTPSKNQSVEITIQDSGAKNQQLAHSSKVQSLKLDQLKPRFKSDQDQRVAQETKAKNLGYLSPKQLQKKNTKDTPSDEKGEKQNLKQLGQDLFDEMASDMNDLHDVKEGRITALNTERFVYYSFYQRVDQRIAPLWTQNLKIYQSRWTKTETEELGGKNHITQIEVVLDKEGHYKDFVIHRSSGFPKLDQAAVEAFKSANLFPNPPHGLIQADGTVRLKYSFRFEVPPPRFIARP
jgi:TonB family protein